MDTQRVAAYIDLDAIRHNVRLLRGLLPAEVKLMAVTKANAYGHGAVAISKTLAKTGVDTFGVATVKEGVQLRQSGIEAPILVLGYSFADSWETAINNNLQLTVFDRETAQGLNSLCEKIGKIGQIHIKLDTGMGRIGLLPQRESLEDIRYIASCKHLHIAGTFSHFATADESDISAAQQQLGRFMDFVESAKEEGLAMGELHICNSAATCTLPQARLDMVRCGIMIYGVYPSQSACRELALRPAMSLCSHISYIKTLPGGSPISYGATYVTERETRVATVPVGYGDGYPRSLSNNGYVLIRGQRAPIIGRVCMDQFMVDVTHLPQVERLDKVTLLGRDGDAEITIEQLAQHSGRLHYELLCDISERVPRCYQSTEE